jgi:hypothetical protein
LLTFVSPSPLARVVAIAGSLTQSSSRSIDVPSGSSIAIRRGTYPDRLTRSTPFFADGHESHPVTVAPSNVATASFGSFVRSSRA